MSVWAGFSEEELRKLQQKEQTVPAALDRGRKPAPTNRSRQQLQRERALQVVTQQKNGPDSHTLPVEQQLSKPPIQAAVQPVSHFSVTHTTVEEDSRQKEPLALNDAPAPAQDTSQITRELEKQEVELREKTRLEFLQRDQKMIEERNKRKKALLTKTIAEKSKQTHAEAVKLKRIQKELQTLDNMVSSDIGILRGVIEQASMDYNAASNEHWILLPLLKPWKHCRLQVFVSILSIRHDVYTENHAPKTQTFTVGNVSQESLHQSEQDKRSLVSLHKVEESCMFWKLP
ncbi:RAB6-interacting golgin isoform X2 [Esox lucius]|uniref:RAB6-interacting golgin isoform X2 n=1 Tax=Esox lucius TaxID=8010 RepID=UPI0009733E75|nr:RAB6-interacting golgin isoform X2 [Esox lucius]